MITGVTAVIPSGDGAPVRAAFSTAAPTSAVTTDSAAEPQGSAAGITKPESSSGGSAPQNRNGDGGDRAATGQYLAQLLAATITGRAPEGRPARITPERLATLITYLESSVSSTAPESSEEEHAVDVKG